MSLSKRARNKNRHSSFVAFQWVLLNSKVYWDLKPSAAKALPYFLGKPKRPFNDPEMYANPGFYRALLDDLRALIPLVRFLNEPLVAAARRPKRSDFASDIGRVID